MCIRFCVFAHFCYLFGNSDTNSVLVVSSSPHVGAEVERNEVKPRGSA